MACRNQKRVLLKQLTRSEHAISKNLCRKLKLKSKKTFLRWLKVCRPALCNATPFRKIKSFNCIWLITSRRRSSRLRQMACINSNKASRPLSLHLKDLASSTTLLGKAKASRDLVKRKSLLLSGFKTQEMNCHSNHRQLARVGIRCLIDYFYSNCSD